MPGGVAGSAAMGDISLERSSKRWEHQKNRVERGVSEKRPYWEVG